MDCIFCKIINKEIPSNIYYEDEKVIVFLDINPREVGHSLIVPKKHYQDIFDIPNDTLFHINDVARQMCKSLKEKLGCDGFTIAQNNGCVQDVKHYHMHIIPKYINQKKLTVNDVYEILK